MFNLVKVTVGAERIREHIVDTVSNESFWLALAGHVLVHVFGDSLRHIPAGKVVNSPDHGALPGLGFRHWFHHVKGPLLEGA